MTQIFVPYSNSTSLAELVRREFIMSDGECPLAFLPYLHAIQKYWPELTNKEAQVNAAMEIYIDVASMEGFQIEPKYLVKQARSYAGPT